MTAFSSTTTISSSNTTATTGTAKSTATKKNSIYSNQKILSILLEYPTLLEYEETKVQGGGNNNNNNNNTAAAAAGCYKVPVWTMYLELVEELWHETTTVFPTIANIEKRVVLGGRPNVRVGDYATLSQDLLQLYLWIGRRAVQYLPGSYKLWHLYLTFLTTHLPQCKAYIQYAYQDCFKRLHKMPRLWMDYLEYLVNSNTTYGYFDVTEWRRIVQQALTSVPVTQHAKIWSVVLPVLEGNNNDTNTPKIPSETCLRMLRRYCLLDPSFRLTLAQLLLLCSKQELARPAEAALIYLELLNDATTPSQSKYKLWVSFSNLVCQYPQECRRVGIDLDALIRGAMMQSNNGNGGNDGGDAENVDDKADDATNNTNNTNYLGEMEGTLWAKLAEYYIRLGNFDMARSIYEEAMNAVSRVRDFSILFDAYSQLEEGMLEQIALGDDENDENKGDDDKGDDDKNNEDDDWDILLGTNTDAGDDNIDDKEDNTTTATKTSSTQKKDQSIEFIMARAEHLTHRRPLLLNRVLLKQNPHNVGEWLTRAALHVKQDQTNLAIATLVTSLQRVHANKAVNGSPSQLVLELVKLYEAQNNGGGIDKARTLLQNVCQEGSYRFRHVDDLAACHAAWIELELRHEQWDDALSLARQSVAPPDMTTTTMTPPQQQKIVKALPKSLRLWDLLLDLEESLGTVATTKDSYNRAMETKVATPLHILNYCSFLKDKKYFEESFTAYERGVELFGFPASKVLWKGYLENFMERYQGTKVERARDLFERCLESCPPEDCADFYLLNGTFEEQYGLTKRALGVYKQMCQKVPDDEKFTAYQLYIAKTQKYMGVTATRDVYQEAIATLNNDDATAKLCLEFSKLESSLQELDRARGILSYGAQMADPRRLPEYWTTWHDFEVAHGNEESFREMLRIKRSVQASFSTVNYNATDMGTNVENLNPEEALAMIANQEGVDVDERQRRGIASQEGSNTIQGFVQQKRTATAAGLEDVEERVAKLRKAAAAADEDEEIDIDDLDDDESDVATTTPNILNVSTKQVPDAVFGGLAAHAKKP